jgi:hypothetical protein
MKEDCGAGMTRRWFLSQATATAALLGSGDDNSFPVRVAVDSQRLSGQVPQNFLGLGYEISSVATNGLLNSTNHVYVQLVRTLGAHGVIRVGGNTSDYASFSPDKKAVAAPKGTRINAQNLRELRTFLDATGWDLIWGLNLGGRDEQNAIEEAHTVADSVKGRLLAFEIGNEPDLFGRAHRPHGYNYEDYLREYREWKAAIRQKLPEAPFAGPDVASATDWVTRFAADEGRDLKLLTHHYYRECANPSSTFEKLLRSDPKLEPELTTLKVASQTSGLPYRICETNSFCGGGKPGVSDTFCSALWAFDFLFKLASAGAAGVNMETGVNQLGFISSYSPVGDDEQGTYSAKPEYYGLLAFAQASRGRLAEVKCDAGEVNLTAYAVLDAERALHVTLINKDASKNAIVDVTISQPGRRGRLMRLTARSLESKEGVKLGGSVVDSSGLWKPSSLEAVRATRSGYKIRIPAVSAAILQTIYD